MAITRLSYVSIKVLDLDVAVRHYTEVIGLRLTGRQDGRAYLQAPDSQDHHCVILNRSDSAGLDHVGFKVDDPQDLDEALDAARRHGLDARRRPAGEILGQGEGVTIVLPSKHSIHLFFHSDRVGYAAGMRNPDPIAEDTTGVNPVSHLDHILVVCPDPAPTVAFLKEALDFNVSEQVLDPAGKLFAAFTTVGHTMHNLAMAPGPEGGLHHLAFYVYDRADVIRRVDLLKHRKVPTLQYGLTRHGVAGVTTTYFFDPSGNRNEFQCGAYETPGVPDRVETINWDLPSMGKGTFYYEGAVAPQFYETVS